jgi:hypothetical protein
MILTPPRQGPRRGSGQTRRGGQRGPAPGIAWAAYGYDHAMTESQQDPTRPLTPTQIAEPLVSDTGLVDEPEDPKEAEEREGPDPA